MSLIQTVYHGTEKPNWLASENCMRRVTNTATQAMAVTETETNKKFVRSGTIFPSNNSNAKGIVFEDVDVTKGNYPCSVMTAGHVYKDRLPVAPTQEAITALKAQGIYFEDAPEFARAYT